MKPTRENLIPVYKDGAFIGYRIINKAKEFNQ